MSIEVIDRKFKKSRGGEAKGEIQIEKHKESFYIPVEWWTLEDYERQWKEGLERIKTRDTSCLVTAIYDPRKRPFIEWWLLYKEGNIIYIQNQIVLEEIYSQLIGDKSFTSETCYNFIEPKEPKLQPDGYEISEWEVKLDD